MIVTEGNVSQISSDRRYFVIKPSGVEYDKLIHEHMVVMDLDGNIVDGEMRPSVDTPTHLEIYRRYPHIGGITHTHSSFATIFAQMKKPIPCYGTTHADAFYDEVPVTRHLTDEEIMNDLEFNTARVIAEILDRRISPCVLVASHGPFAFGRDAKESVNHAAIAEQVAMMAILGQYESPVQKALIEKHFQRKHGKARYYGQT